jgi:hypothetical protein
MTQINNDRVLKNKDNLVPGRRLELKGVLQNIQELIGSPRGFTP